MGWTNELYQVYELACQNPKDRPLPVSRSTQNAQIQVNIDEHGNFKGASAIDKDNAVTIIPVTEDSGARTNGNCPMPLADKLVYIAGDFQKFTEGIYISGQAPKKSDAKRSDNKDFFRKYMEQLDKWRTTSPHPAVSAVFVYLQKMTLMEDLIKSGVLQTDPVTGKLLPKVKIAAPDILQESAFVRFYVQYADTGCESRTWMDQTLYDSFDRFNSSLMENEQLCYATGRILPVAVIHPSGIVKQYPLHKLISSNDDKGFTFRGRFANREQALSVSYDFSQKMHNALKWLIQKQGQSFGSLTLVIWASALAHLPKESFNDDEMIEDEWEDDEVYDSLELYREWLTRYLTGYPQLMQTDTKVMILGLDVPAKEIRRLSIALYDELQGSEFLRNLENWHNYSAWMRYDRKRGNCVKSFSLYEIIRSAYGTEQNGILECDDKLKSKQILRLLPCVMNAKPVPHDLITALYHKASNPLAYDVKAYNHRLVIEVTCGMYRAEMKGECPVSYDEKETDRSYLYGCLLAIADKAESDTYEKDDKETGRVTNARRYWANFAQRPYRTWRIIEERLRPYLDKLDYPYRVNVEKHIQEIMDKFASSDFADNSRLDTLYLLGYHHFMAYMYRRNKDN